MIETIETALRNIVSTKPIVELRDVSLSFGDKKVLDDVSLVVEPQERLAIIGQSGAGKTTILRLILGILAPTKGSVFFKQLEIPRLGSHELQIARTKIGMVYQDILMHVGERSTAEALPAIIANLQGRGFHLVTVSKLLE